MRRSRRRRELCPLRLRLDRSSSVAVVVRICTRDSTAKSERMPQSTGQRPEAPAPLVAIAMSGVLLESCGFVLEFDGVVCLLCSGPSRWLTVRRVCAGSCKLTLQAGISAMAPTNGESSGCESRLKRLLEMLFSAQFLFVESLSSADRLWIVRSDRWGSRCTCWLEFQRVIDAGCRRAGCELTIGSTLRSRSSAA